MALYYETITSNTTSALHLDLALLSCLEKANEEELAKLDARLWEAAKTEGETEIIDSIKAGANYMPRIGDKDLSIKARLQAIEKTLGLGSRINMVVPRRSQDYNKVLVRRRRQ